MSDPLSDQAFETSTTPTSPFDVMYLALRRRLLLQCFALTGDLAAARAGVRDAFIAARQQWKRVDSAEQPEAWIRQRAMRAAQRHHVPHRRRTVAGLTEQQSGVLRALGTLKDSERKALILCHLGDLGVSAIGRELSLSESAARQRLHTAETSFASSGGFEPSATAAQLRALAPIVTHPGLPRTPMIHRRARRRSRLHVAVGVVAALAAATLGGAVLNPTPRSATLDLINARPLTPANLLTAAQVSSALATVQSGTWQQSATDQSTEATAPLDQCQPSRLADASPATARARQFKSTTSGATLVQRSEVSIGDAAAAATYARTLSWYADCTQSRVQVAAAATLQGVGNQAWYLQLNVEANPAQTYQVVVARSGMITSTLVLITPDQPAQPPQPAAGAASSQAALVELGRLATQNLCMTSAAEKCGSVAHAVATAAIPPTFETPGMLATVDLPALAGIQRPWVGTAPVIGGINLAATACDGAAFPGAVTKSRSFLIPDAGLPQSFGLTETVATYPTAAAASAAAAQISDAMSNCHKRQIATTVDQQQTSAATTVDAAASIWHEMAQVTSQSDIVTYWMGITQVGRYVAQTTLIPAANANTNAVAFLALVQRSAGRLNQQ